MNNYGFSVLLALLCAGNTALADVPPVELNFVRDLNTTPGSSNADPHAFATIGGNVYFAASTPATGIELFRTNGTASGLRLVRDFDPGPASSNPNVIGPIGQRFIVETMTPNFEAQIWSVADDGSAVRLPIDGYDGWFSGRFKAVGTIGGLMVLDSDSETSLWVTDGTPAGTKALTDDIAFPLREYREGFCSLGQRAVLFGDDRADGRHALVATDGTAAGSTVLAHLDGYVAFRAIPAVALNGICYLQLQAPGGWRLWASDGSVAGTREIASGVGFDIYGLAAMGGNLYVAGVSSTRFRVARHAPDGAWAETLLDTAGSANRQPFLVVDNHLVFAGPYDPAQPYALGLYLSDGTNAGTRRVFPTATANLAMNWTRVSVLNGVVIFGPNGGRPAWRVDLATGALSAPLDTWGQDVFNSARLGNRLITAGSDARGMEVWTTDGTPQGTLFLHDVWATTNDGVAVPSSGIERASFGSSGKLLYFNGTIGDYSTALWNLWRTDGTAAGTRRLLPDRYDGRTVTALAARSDGVVFRSGDFIPNAGARYWKADANLDTATPVTSTFSYSSSTLQRNGDDAYFMCPGVSNSPGLCRITPTGQALLVRSQIGTQETFVPIGNLGSVSVFFTGTGQELWRTDGTFPGTFRIAQEVVNATFEGEAVPSAVANGKLYVAMCRNLGGGCGLMTTDGTVAGTAFVADLPDNDIGSMAAVGDRVVFTRRVNGTSQLWASDGTAAGTGILHSEPYGYMSAIAVTGSTAHVSMQCSCFSDYIVTDGTVAGTQGRSLPGDLAGRADAMFSVGNAAVFSCQSNATGTELCIADSRGETIRFLADIYPGMRDSFTRYLGQTADAAYIAADDGYHGRELWRLSLPDAIFANGFQGGNP